MGFDSVIYNRACEAIHNGALTNSKRPETFVKGVYPTHVVKGIGCHLIDTKKAKYLDYICGLGSNLMGYANPEITKAITDQLHNGSIYSLSSLLEVEAAELLKGYLHFCGKIRFLKTGTEACFASLKIARSHTGRDIILSDGYHGFADPFVSLSPPAVGVPKDPNIRKLTDIEQIDDSIAGVIIEPIMVDYSKQRIEWLIELQAKCKKHGTVLIFDEIITGFRWKNLTFSNDSGIFPDILLLGKSAGGGLPISIIATKPGIGDGKEWFISGTFAGETLSIAAMIQTLKMLKSTHNINSLWSSGQVFQDEFNKLNKNLQLLGYPTRGVFQGDDMTKALFFQESCKAGILFGPSFFYNFCHPDYNEITINSCKDVMMRIKTNAVKLEGEMPKSPFAQKQRQ